MIIVSSLLVSVGSQTYAQIDDMKEFTNPVVILETNLGEITIEFFYQDAPNHVENFLKLAGEGFYNGTLFHRVIPGFMIQGGDPNTISGDPITWGTGGPTIQVDAEFNTIKHNRGIVSMARSTDPNSAGSQFFIVHQNSNFLDGEYTVFGRIVTEESFETLDKIIALETGDKDIPLDTEKVRITKITIVNRSEVSNLLELPEPERTSSITPLSSMGNQKFESAEHKIAFNVPEGWLLQQLEKTTENSPDVAAVGPATGGVINPVISLTIQQSNQKTFDELISEKMELLDPFLADGSLKIISQEKVTYGTNNIYEINAEGIFSHQETDIEMKFKEVLFYSTEKLYTFAYSNHIDDFDSQLPKFHETINSFEFLNDGTGLIGSWKVVDEETKITDKEGGGCLIATATFGSELAPQIQQLRELRDNTILSTESGSAFMSGFNQLYYSFSPTIADLERESPIFKEVVKLSITPMLSSLSLLNYVDIDSEQEIISYGIGIILMNIGMYFAAPTIIIYKIRKQITK